ncbi:putative oligosaccharyltransferase complex subunit ostc-B [Apostichopus japonicus]|uniref:Oligosaccharyltransferase complex subunit n=1 Tax=Stichopus japonicus TaxID=307972 RepID=A0A2G8KUG5_STIJA|nr:putative oligosaccharyltransferase complex subunit ostc-B [Apostichopus japonicus]
MPEFKVKEANMDSNAFGDDSLSYCFAFIFSSNRSLVNVGYKMRVMKAVTFLECILLIFNPSLRMNRLEPAVGVIYDVIVEPPSVGQTTDENGHQKPVAFMPYRVNGQYIMEGLASSFLFTIGGLGFVVLDLTNAPYMAKLNRLLLLMVGFSSILISFFMCRMFMRMKLPGYLES